MFTGHALGMNSSAWSPRANYVIALPIIAGATAAMYQYLKTGKGPTEPMDYIAPKTGGLNADGKTPERLYPIGT